MRLQEVVEKPVEGRVLHIPMHHPLLNCRRYFPAQMALLHAQILQETHPQSFLINPSSLPYPILRQIRLQPMRNLHCICGITRLLLMLLRFQAASVVVLRLPEYLFRLSPKTAPTNLFY